MFARMFSGMMPEGLQRLSFTLINTICFFYTFKQSLSHTPLHALEGLYVLRRAIHLMKN